MSINSQYGTSIWKHQHAAGCEVKTFMRVSAEKSASQPIHKACSTGGAETVVDVDYRYPCGTGV